MGKKVDLLALAAERGVGAGSTIRALQTHHGDSRSPLTLSSARAQYSGLDHICPKDEAGLTR